MPMTVIIAIANLRAGRPQTPKGARWSLWSARNDAAKRCHIDFRSERHRQRFLNHPNAFTTRLIAAGFRFFTFTRCFDRPA